ncbi:type II secretion system F family protein [Methylocella sp. CPCC 101449]|jgi:tight adherence protein C|uniref:type II secretion system F family protein n=1 Tax=Methylocella sp. CPCC 101449 TaxID=2987531 RepID=UPI00288CD8F7|nr:type II secretion system F family protein [Methylocella sp. CPCC 101449]MDT2019277.1 type II secretion system F family protein [Methylocella sp. CPCC 101449]HEV2573324.1 type II secretion system F family protein [Beijerinckiaceae bacterium]
MIGTIVERLNDPQVLLTLVIAVACAAAVITIGLPLLETDTLNRRMKAVGTERERIRARERERMKNSQKVTLRQQPKAYMKQIVDQFNLSKWLGTDSAKEQMAMAGFRGPQAETAFLFFRLVAPLLTFFLTLIYVFLIINWEAPPIIKLGAALAMAYIGIKGPELYIRNTIQKRQQSMRRAFPDALDLLLICVESGSSIEQAFRRVSQEIGVQSVPLAEEFTLATAELSYLQDRRVAFDNLGKRTGLESIQQIVTVLIQSEKYGTPLGQALRVVSQESRESRMTEAEKKAAALPPKLTVPMILFFLPVLFAVIMTPAIIQIMAIQ